MSRRRFENKIVFISGATKGIGKETALKFAKEGAKLIVNYRNQDKSIEEMQHLIDEEHLMLCQADVSNELEVKAMFEAIGNKFGKIDVVINNAAIIDRSHSWDDIKIAEWEKVFSVNVIGASLICKYAKPLINEGGSIVNLSSIYGIFGSSTELAYSLSKAAIINFTQTLAKSLAPGIRVNAVAPGNTITQMVPSSDKMLEIEKATLLKRSARAHEIANVIAFLASDESSYITGEVINVDGGYHIK